MTKILAIANQKGRCKPAGEGPRVRGSTAGRIAASRREEK